METPTTTFYRTLGRSGLQVSALGLGCWASPLATAAAWPSAHWILRRSQRTIPIPGFKDSQQA